MAVASSSKNASQMMRQINVDSGRSLLDVFSANVCGRDLPQGKPNPAIFLLAAREMRVAPAHCFVVEDAPAGIQAAEAAGAALIVVTTTHKHPLDTRHPTITAYGKLTAALLRG